MNDISLNEVLIAVLFGVAFSAGAMFWYRRQRASAWSGTVEKIEEKKVNMGQDENGNLRAPKTYCIIRYALDKGSHKTLKLEPYQMALHFPGGIQAGDRLIKEAGKDGYRVESMPEKE